MKVACVGYFFFFFEGIQSLLNTLADRLAVCFVDTNSLKPNVEVNISDIDSFDVLTVLVREDMLSGDTVIGQRFKQMAFLTSLC